MVDDLYQDTLHRKFPQPLFLDCRFLGDLNHMLKFLEEYKGDITLWVQEPVQGTIISRFWDIRKSALVESDNFMRRILEKKARPSIRERIGNLFFENYNA